MIEWILTDNHFIYLSIILISIAAVFAVIAIILALDAIELKIRTETRQRLAMIFAALFAVSTSSIFYISEYITIENVTEGDWVQIYSNDQNANISIYFSPTSSMKAGEELSSSDLNKLKTLYSRNETEDVTVSASKDGAEERRAVNLDGRNISIPLNRDHGMKITKIEYQKIVGQRKTLFGHTGNVSKSYLDGQIKVTVNGEKSDQSLKELFDGKKQ